MLNLSKSRQLKKLWEIVLEMSSGFACNKNYERLWWYVHLRTHNISIDWTLNFDLIVEIDPKKVDIKKNYIQKWDILFNNTNSKELVWKTALVDKNYPYAYSNHITKFQLKEGCSPKYIVFFLNYLWGRGYFQEKCNKWIWQAWFNNSMLKEIQIPLPSLEEQKKIVAYLDELNATISKLKSEYQSQLAMLDEMRNSSLDLAFWGSRERERAYNLNNWKWVKLGEVCEILDSKRKPITQKDRIDWPYPYYWATWIVDYVNNYLFDEKLVLIWEDWAKWGSGENTAFSVEGKIWVNNHAHVLRPFRKQLCDDFLIYYLLIKDLSEYITGTTVPKLNQEKLKNIEIPLPDLETQSQIVAHLDQVHQQITMLKTQVNSQIEHCDELWQSSLEKVLTQGVNNEFN